MTLSEEVQLFIRSRDPDETGLTAEELSELQKGRVMVDLVVDDIVKSRETIIASEGELFEKALMSDSDLLETLLDERFTRDVVGEVPGYVSRTLQFRG